MREIIINQKNVSTKNGYTIYHVITMDDDEVIRSEGIPEDKLLRYLEEHLDTEPFTQ